MKIHNKLDELFGSSVKLRILRLLFNEKQEFSGRGISRIIKSSPSFTHNALKELVKEKYINVKKIGTACMYSIKNTYIIKEFIGPLFDKEKAVYKDLILFIKQHLLVYKTKITSLIIFGSIVTMEEKEESDIDILVVVNKSKDRNFLDQKIDDIIVEAVKEFDIIISPYMLTESEIKKKYKQKSEIIIEILNKSQLVYGEPLERILS